MGKRAFHITLSYQDEDLRMAFPLNVSQAVQSTLCSLLWLARRLALYSPSSKGIVRCGLSPQMWAVNVISSTYDLKNLVFPARQQVTGFAPALQPRQTLERVSWAKKARQFHGLEPTAKPVPHQNEVFWISEHPRAVWPVCKYPGTWPDRLAVPQ